ncbi:MAG: serine/threonine protein kinase [Psychromonas sp.]|jgi:serine/threonine protein kinase|uniref:protein kinase domain-containing protein n=1 Tax=Psychromonas sp. TaxID=1884585 RepID=UPI0039E55042
MSQALSVSIGQATDKGVKEINQDAIGHLIPQEPLLSTKGIVLAMADGISSSRVSQIASTTAVASFLEDYYCTSDAWAVKTSAQKVIKSINYWLYAQTRNSPYRFERDKGYVATFSALVLKSNTAHLFHSGDTRIFRVLGNQLEQLTKDHRRVVSSEVNYLTRALGIDPILEIDYHSEPIEKNDVFLIATDGVYEFISHKQILGCIADSETLDIAAQQIITQAISAGSDDNLSIQIVRIENLPNYQLSEVQQHLTLLPLPPRLMPRMQFDGYEILREIYISSRSHVFLALDSESRQTVVIKTPSTELRNNRQYLENFMLEEWIAKRLNNAHVAKALEPPRKRHFLYLVSEYIDGITLNQWMIDNPKPTINQVRAIVEQTAKGLQAFHRQEMVHQDLRPNNIMIDSNNIVKIIDFGSTFIAGVTDIKNEQAVRGTMRYSAPEYFLGEVGSPRSDIYALAVVTYQMLSGRFPYHAEIAQVRSLSAQRRLVYKSLINDDIEFPIWIDDTLRKALNVEPLKRYAELSEFVHDLHHPNKAFISRTSRPLIERDPVMFWQGVSFILLLIIVIQLVL